MHPKTSFAFDSLASAACVGLRTCRANGQCMHPANRHVRCHLPCSVQMIASNKFAAVDYASPAFVWSICIASSPALNKMRKNNNDAEKLIHQN
jgi:hypothetical protein